MTSLAVDVPRKLAPLLQPARYKGAHGGRGGAKSHFFAEQLVLRCYRKPTRWVCIREVQNTMRESVRQLLVDKIQKLGLGTAFEVLEGEIRGRNGSLIVFKGMQSYNAENIKSLEDFDGAWIEEAQTLSERSLRLLRPTIRKEGSEIWASWNPRYETDPIDEFFRGDTPPKDAILVEVNWRDNPWFPNVLRDEMELDRQRDPEMAVHVWDGGYEVITEGAYYAKLIAHAEADGRCGDFPHDPAKLVRTGWDIGVDDYSAVWFLQDDGIEATAIDYFEANGLGAPQIVLEALPEMLPDGTVIEGETVDVMVRAAQRVAIGRSAPYRYGEHFLPHDVRNREWGGGAKSRAQTLLELGMKDLHVGVAQGPAERINAVRQVLPNMRFNTGRQGQQPTPAQKRVRAGLNMNTYTTVAEHDVNSHGADALGEWAVNARIVPAKPVPPPPVKGLPGQVRLPPPPEHNTQGRIRL
jgi:hypothetical protein